MTVIRVIIQAAPEPTALEQAKLLIHLPIVLPKPARGKSMAARQAVGIGVVTKITALTRTIQARVAALIALAETRVLTEAIA